MDVDLVDVIEILSIGGVAKSTPKPPPPPKPKSNKLVKKHRARPNQYELDHAYPQDSNW